MACTIKCWSERNQQLKARIAILTFLMCLQGWQPARASEERSDPPQLLYQDLYTAVEFAGIFPDSKEFADAVPKSSVADVLAEYHLHQPRSHDELKQFVNAHFLLPQRVAPAPAARSYRPAH
jgi:neutral trehalase